MAKKLSTGFTSSTTRSMDGLSKEIETRLESMEKSFREFDYAADTSKGPDQYGKPHDDFAAQHEDDQLDQKVHEWQAEIKRPKDQFPGAKMSKTKDGPSDNAAFDVHATDPMRLQDGVQQVSGNQYRVVYKGQGRGIYPNVKKAEEVFRRYKERVMGKIETGEALSKEIERRMKLP